MSVHPLGDAGGLDRNTDLAHTAEWELYHNSFSLCSKKVRVCLAELGVPYVGHHIDLIETGYYQTLSKPFLKVNPAGTVPVLVHKGHPVYQSHAQMAYAATSAGELGESLHPTDPALRAEVDVWKDRASIVGDRPISAKATAERAGPCCAMLTMPLFAAMVGYIPVTEILKGFVRHPNKERPALFTMLKLAGVKRLGALRPMMHMLARGRRDMGMHLDALGAKLASHDGDWICGDRFTLADVSWLVVLDRLIEADWDHLFWGEGRRPKVAAYMERVQARPSFGSQIEDVRCELTRRGMADLKKAKVDHPRLRMALEGD